MAPGAPAFAEVVAAFGEGILGPEGAVDRRALGAIVFADPAARARLERHRPPARARRRSALGRRPGPPGDVPPRDRRGASRRVGGPSAVRPPGRGGLSARDSRSLACGSATASTRRRPEAAWPRRCRSIPSGASVTRLSIPRGAWRRAARPRTSSLAAWASLRPRRVRPRSRCRGSGPCARSRSPPRRARGEPAPPRWPGCWRSGAGPTSPLSRARLRPGATGPWWRAPPEGPSIPSDPRPARRTPSGRLPW